MSTFTIVLGAALAWCAVEAWLHERARDRTAREDTNYGGHER